MLHVGATVICAHAGQAWPVTPNQRVMVSGQPTVTQPSSWLVTGCTMPPRPIGFGPCLSATFVAGSTRVMSLGQPLVLMDSASIVAPAGIPLIVVTAQQRVLAT